MGQWREAKIHALKSSGIKPRKTLSYSSSRHPWGLRGFYIPKTTVAAFFTTSKQLSHCLLISSSLGNVLSVVIKSSYCRMATLFND
uniref:Uncharacterized protein n=1 Tax=Megaselia scalaris TaxID=36166 RepID=T1GXA9_MEGSC